ncbi:MAG: LD-carboxypeptidase [Candidatus Parcubacteria bacterium]|nr:LD-carboxypeptidase [Candidatus Parcubacteria bacterium]
MKPKKIKSGQRIRVIAPVRSMSIIGEECKKIAIDRFNKVGLDVTFAKHVDEIDEFNSSSIESRIEDLHEAFADKNIDAIFTAIGGYNSNQLLQYIDYKLIANNPKIICGFSDVTALTNAITAKTGMITYLGPHFSSWGMKLGFEHSLDYFIKCCVNDSSYYVSPSNEWSDDPWYLHQDKRHFIKNSGYWVMNKGYAVGRIIGGHVRCLNSLQGTDYWPGLVDSILVLEEDEEINPPLFDRQLQSLIHQSEFFGVKGIIIGRFQNQTKMTRELLQKIINTKKELKDIPIIANLDIGHTTPQITIPVGGSMELLAKENDINIKIIEH